MRRAALLSTTVAHDRTTIAAARDERSYCRLWRFDTAGGSRRRKVASERVSRYRWSRTLGRRRTSARGYRRPRRGRLIHAARDVIREKSSEETSELFYVAATD